MDVVRLAMLIFVTVVYLFGQRISMKKTMTLMLLLVLAAYSMIAVSNEPQVNSSNESSSKESNSSENSAEALSHFQPAISPELKELFTTADIEAGHNYFLRKCSSCHDDFKSDTHGKGPNLWNIMGRKAGSAAGFKYSDAMRQSGHTWNYATLNYYLTDTKRAVPGRIMNFKGIKKDKDRAKLLLFLRSMNDNPPSLPE
jgi:cytochrome c